MLVDQPKIQVSRLGRRVELFSTILLALATVATAWCAYQSTLWGGIQTFQLSDANTAARHAAEKTILSHQTRMIHIELFMNYLNAKSQENTSLAKFYHDRFPDELELAHDAWMTKNPIEDPNAPLHPFALPEYKLDFDVEAAQANVRSETRYKEAREANQYADNYILFTVLFASVLFFGGIATRFSSPKIRLAVFLIGFVVFIAAVVGLAYQPVTILWSGEYYKLS